MDLDNTLYSEIEYINSCVEILLEEIGTEFSMKEWKIQLQKYYEDNGNSLIFDNFLVKELQLPKESLKTFLNILRFSNINFNIKFYPGVENFLKSNSGRVIIVTDGNPHQQKRKVQLLQLSEFITSENIIYSSLYEGKDSVKFKKFLQEFLIKKKLQSSDGWVIGDNSIIDQALARNFNFEFIHVQKGDFFREYV